MISKGSRVRFPAGAGIKIKLRLLIFRIIWNCADVEKMLNKKRFVNYSILEVTEDIVHVGDSCNPTKDHFQKLWLIKQHNETKYTKHLITPLHLHIFLLSMFF